MKRKQVIIIILLLALTITGCGKANDKTTSGGKSKGRYVESTLPLPEDIGKNVSLQLTKKDGMPFLYNFSGEENLAVTGYRLDKDGNWSEDTPEWLKSLKIQAASSYMDQVFEDASGNQYLYYVEIIDDSYKGNLLRSTDGSACETLVPEGWDKKDPQFDIYMAPEKVAVLADGTLAALYYSGDINFYNPETMKNEFTVTDEAYSRDSIMKANGGRLLLGKNDNDLKFTGIDVLDTKKGYTKTNYPFQSKLSSSGYNAYLDINENNDIILCNSDGIHILEQDTSTWQTVVDGTLTSLTMQSLWSSGFVSGSDGNYYVLFNSENGYSFMKYSYDKNMDSIPSIELTVYSLKDNTTLRQAAALFQQKNPDVRVTITTAMTEQEFQTADETIKKDLIKALNTELLAGGGTDILALDGLPIDSFIEKGVLADLSDIINPMTDNGELLNNIADVYRDKDKIFCIPARFGLPLLCGRNDDVKQLTSLESLAGYAADKDSSLFGGMTTKDFITAFAPYLTSKIMTTDGLIDKEKLTAVLSQLKAIGNNTGILDEYPEDSRAGNNMWDLASSSQLCLVPVAGFNNSLFPLGIVSYVGGSFTIFEDSFIPQCELGINNNSSKKDLCKEFIKLVLSEEIGKSDFYDGFPINKQALTLNSQIDRSAYEAYSEIENEDGSSSPIAFKALNQNQLEEFMQACSTVTKRAVCDEQIVNVMIEESVEFFKGNLTAEETADHIIEKTSVYLSE